MLLVPSSQLGRISGANLQIHAIIREVVDLTGVECVEDLEEVIGLGVFLQNRIDLHGDLLA